MKEVPSELSDRALEMVMRDVLDGIQELAVRAALRSGPRGCRIIAIEPARGERAKPPAERSGSAQVVDLQSYRKAACS